MEDSQLTAVVWGDWAARELLPAEHAVDMGYTSAALLVQAMTEHDVTLLAPCGPLPVARPVATTGSA